MWGDVMRHETIAERRACEHRHARVLAPSAVHEPRAEGRAQHVEDEREAVEQTWLGIGLGGRG